MKKVSKAVYSAASKVVPKSVADKVVDNIENYEERVLSEVPALLRTNLLVAAPAVYFAQEAMSTHAPSDLAVSLVGYGAAIPAAYAYYWADTAYRAPKGQRVATANTRTAAIASIDIFADAMFYAPVFWPVNHLLMDLNVNGMTISDGWSGAIAAVMGGATYAYGASVFVPVAEHFGEGFGRVIGKHPWVQRSISEINSHLDKAPALIDIASKLV